MTYVRMTGKNEKINKITKDYLKKQTQEFDIGCIYNLNLSLLGIYDLGCIGECTNLVILNLSSNSISSTKHLASLKQLQILQLANNRISELSGLEELESLYSLDVAGNFLNSIDSLFPLKTLESFENLRLNDSATGSTNPVCQSNKSYEEEVMEMLPGLKLLDGVLLNGKGREFSDFCGKLDVALKEREKEISHRRSISYEKTLVLPETMDASLLDMGSFSATERRITKLIEDCEKSNERAKKVIAAAERKNEI